MEESPECEDQNNTKEKGQAKLGRLDELQLKSLQQQSKDELIKKIMKLSKEKRRLQTRLADFEPQKQRKLKGSTNDKVKKLFEEFEVRKYALKVCYIGVSYDGMAFQVDTDNTIEQYLFKILYTLSLIPDPTPGAGYTRAGRTDKGVSAMGNVVALPLRTSIKKSGAEESSMNSMNYCSMLNALLPEDIRILAFEEVQPDFNARYHCTQRSYKYFFAKNNLNIELMRQAMQSFIGTHNFVNYCKMNLANCVNFQRTIRRAEIHKADNNQVWMTEDDRNQIYYFYYVGNSFLWHQIRFMSSILFLVGAGQQQASIIQELLDLEKYPSKPNYQMAPEYPLILEDCLYDNIKFHPDRQTTKTFYNTFNQMVMKKSVEKTLLINCINLAMKGLASNIKFTESVFMEEVRKKSNRLLSRKRKPLAIHKCSGPKLEEAIQSLRGKKLDMYQKKAQKQADYEQKKKKQTLMANQNGSDE